MTAFMPNQWFERLFGFKESVLNVEKYMDPPIKDGDNYILESKANHMKFNTGNFQVKYISDFRELPIRNGGTFNILYGHGHKTKNFQRIDSFSMQSLPENDGATYLAASNFNCLEFVSHFQTADSGVTNYVYDITQGPYTALACPQSAVYRNYFCKVPGKNVYGQLKYSINLLSKTPLNVRNGYVLIKHDEIDRLNKMDFSWDDKNNYAVGVHNYCDVLMTRKGSLFEYVGKYELPSEEKEEKIDIENNKMKKEIFIKDKQKEEEKRKEERKEKAEDEISKEKQEKKDKMKDKEIVKDDKKRPKEISREKPKEDVKREIVKDDKKEKLKDKERIKEDEKIGKIKDDRKKVQEIPKESAKKDDKKRSKEISREKPKGDDNKEIAKDDKKEKLKDKERIKDDEKIGKIKDDRKKVQEIPKESVKKDDKKRSKEISREKPKKIDNKEIAKDDKKEKQKDKERIKEDEKIGKIKDDRKKVQEIPKESAKKDDKKRSKEISREKPKGDGNKEKKKDKKDKLKPKAKIDDDDKKGKDKTEDHTSTKDKKDGNEIKKEDNDDNNQHKSQKERPIIANHVYAASFNFNGDVVRDPFTQKIASSLLKAEYEATILSAWENSVKMEAEGRKGARKLYLTLLGGGVFGNPLNIISLAIDSCSKIIKESGLEVYLVCFDEYTYQKIERDIKHLVEDTKGKVINVDLD